jgi:hypothetical protein
LPTGAVVGGSAPTFADLLAVCYRVSPGEKALPFHRKRPAHEAPTKKMLKYCGDELDPKSRTLFDYHPVEVARQMALVVRADFCARATERADVACLDEGRGRRARARLPEHQAHHQPVQPHQPLGGVGNSARHRRRADAPQPCSSASSSWRTAAATCRTCTGVYAGLNQWRAVQRLKGLWAKLPTKWEKRYGPKSTSSVIPSRTRPRSRARVGVAGV